MVWMWSRHRARERERTRLTILDYGEENGSNGMTVEKKKPSQNPTVKWACCAQRTSDGSCALHVVADLHHKHFSSTINRRVRPFTVIVLESQNIRNVYAKYTVLMRHAHTHKTEFGLLHSFTSRHKSPQTKVQLYSIHKRGK